MTKRDVGFAFHVHHDQLVEWCFSLKRRKGAIRMNKPKSEQALRLKLLWLIPLRLIPGHGSPEYQAHAQTRQADDQAQLDYRQARLAYDQANLTYDQAREAFSKAGEAFGKARRTLEEAQQASEQAQRDYEKKYKVKLEALHTKLCPDCPWDGKTIFS